MYIMCLIIFEEKAEIQDQQPLSLNRERDHLQKYRANVALSIKLLLVPFVVDFVSKAVKYCF